MASREGVAFEFDFAVGDGGHRCLPSVPYVLVTETSSRSIGLEDVCDTCCRRFSSKQTSAARHKNVLAQRPCEHLVETLK